MKQLYLLLLLLLSYFSFAQEKWITESGTIKFEASVPLFEEISAQNNVVKCVINSEEKTIVCLLKIKDFEFKRDLMRTHFNEIYLESDKNPRATFKGSIPDFDINKISSKGTILTLDGTIKIHGISKKMSVSGIFKKVNNQLKLAANFIIDTDDFKIKIPSMILPKVSKKVQTKIEFTLQ